MQVQAREAYEQIMLKNSPDTGPSHKATQITTYC